ncbi:MAG: hypothetical protein IPQ02_17330 [Saprospiraceae bacterium]|uniref:Uncharacterized protein n=1 Tax=Candidatus Defluviibacterium haderslevense TaxID=2981993 RepID=A0A9D7XCU7_9BACT|nr:hypothetical protein [Candidatus Defluviibacterium haderslevense]MBL0238298.1 hypothetical protein [Candidatus Defluviibacterium haderslevense]
MKKLIFITSILSVLIGCSKDDNISKTNNPSTANLLTVKIDGVLWEGTITENELIESINKISVVAIKSSSQEIFRFNFDNYEGLGAYPKPKDRTAWESFSIGNNKVYFNFPGSGLIINFTSEETVGGIKKFHGNLSGTLAPADGGDDLQFTEGKF